MATAPLLASPSKPHHIIGLVAALRAGAALALDAVLDELPRLRADPKFGEVITALSWYQRKDVTWLPPLKRLVNVRTDVPGLDAAAASALAKIRSKEVLPLMIDLLDSKDPQVPLAIALYFGRYAMFADENGEMRDSGPDGPFLTPETKAFTPSRDTAMTSEQYRTFWKNWWEQNRAKITATNQPTTVP